MGASSQPAAKWKAHARERLWWPSVARKAVYWYDTRAGAVAAEEAAVLEEKPLHNIAYTELHRKIGGYAENATPEDLAKWLAADWPSARRMYGQSVDHVQRAVDELLAGRKARQLQHLDGDPRNNDPANLELRDRPDAP